MNAVYAPSERELMRDLPVREQALVHTLKHFTQGEISCDLGVSEEESGLEPVGKRGAALDERPGVPAKAAGALRVRIPPEVARKTVYTDPEDLEFGKPKRTRPIYALVWTHKQHKVYKTKAKAQRSSRAWKLWHERWGFKVSSHATGFFALKGDEKRACLIHEYDKDSKERLK